MKTRTCNETCHETFGARCPELLKSGQEAAVHQALAPTILRAIGRSHFIERVACCVSRKAPSVLSARGQACQDVVAGTFQSQDSLKQGIGITGAQLPILLKTYLKG